MVMLGSFVTAVITIGMVSVSILMIGLILLQKNRGSGLSGAFGGVGGHTAFGTKTGDFLTWVTVGLTAVFLILAIIGNYAFEPEKTLNAAPAPVTTPVQPGSDPSQGAQPIQVQTTPIEGGNAPTPAPVSPAPAAPAAPAPTTQPS